MNKHRRFSIQSFKSIEYSLHQINLPELFDKKKKRMTYVINYNHKTTNDSNIDT